MLVIGAWLSEHKANTIDPPNHSEVFARLEKYAVDWGYTDLAVCCRKYRAVILDEYGNDRVQALSVLDEGFKLYGETNSELIRAKAKVLYRSEDHKGSLELSKTLIESDAPLAETEKAFLGREAAISAEKQGDFETARNYYLYGSNAAGNCDILDMIPMEIGLMADAALASWHHGDRETCLRDFITVLNKLNELDPKSSLRAAHCNAVCRHVLLWLDQEATGVKKLLAGGEEVKIYPGGISNPEPHPDIGKRHIVQIDMAWYMLASVENDCCLDVGITQNLGNFLPNGPIFEGQFYLTLSKQRKAFMLFDADLFITTLKETVAEFAYVNEKAGHKDAFDIMNVTYGTFPIPTLEQQANLTGITEQFLLCFVSNCIFAERTQEMESLLKELEEVQGFKIRDDILNSLRDGNCTNKDYYTYMAMILANHMQAAENKKTLSPALTIELVFKALEVACQINKVDILAKPAFEWLSKKWSYIWNNQRFLLKLPALYEKSITQALIADENSSVVKVIDLLLAILPTMEFQNESQLSQMLNDMRDKSVDLH